MDSPAVASIFVVIGLLALLGAGIWMFAAMLIVSVVGLVVLKDYSFDRIGTLMQAVMWKSTTSGRWSLASRVRVVRTIRA